MEMKRKRLMPNGVVMGLVAGLALLFVACGGKGAAPPPEATPEVVEPSCLPEGVQVPEHLVRWASMCDTWDPLRIDPQLQGAVRIGLITPEDGRKIAEALQRFEVARRVALVTNDLDWIKRLGVATPRYEDWVERELRPVLERIDREREQNEGLRYTDFEVGHYSPTLTAGMQGAGGLSFSVRSCARTIKHYSIDPDTGAEVKPMDERSRVVDVQLVRTADGRVLVDDYKTVNAPCPYDGAAPFVE